jgi:hypothetical protein
MRSKSDIDANAPEAVVVLLELFSERRRRASNTQGGFAE